MWITTYDKYLLFFASIEQSLTQEVVGSFLWVSLSGFFTCLVENPLLLSLYNILFHLWGLLSLEVSTANSFVYLCYLFLQVIFCSQLHYFLYLSCEWSSVIFHPHALLLLLFCSSSFQELLFISMSGHLQSPFFSSIDI